jgi:hypothetical protein
MQQQVASFQGRPSQRSAGARGPALTLDGTGDSIAIIGAGGCVRWFSRLSNSEAMMQLWCRVLCVAWLVVGMARVAGGQGGPPNGQKLYYPECQRFAPSIMLDCYHSYPEVAQFLEDAADQFPQFARLESIGKSYQGRDLWVLTVTDFDVGSPEHKPAMWVDGSRTWSRPSTAHFRRSVYPSIASHPCVLHRPGGHPGRIRVAPYYPGAPSGHDPQTLG